MATAFTREDGGNVLPKMLVVRCTGRDLEVFVRFREFLDNNAVPITMRIDRQSVLSNRWDVSPSGTEVFAPGSVGLAHDLARGSTFIIEARDFCGSVHRATFDLTGVGGKTPASAARSHSSLSGGALKNIAAAKQITTTLGFYKRPLNNSTMEPAFAQAVQKVYDHYVHRCCRGDFGDDSMCYVVRVAELKIPALTVLIELTPKEQCAVYGAMRMGE